MCTLSFNIANISTIISIILSIVAILYTFISGKKSFELFNKTKELLIKIDSQNKKLVDKINQELSKDAYDKKNIIAVRESRRT